MKKFRVAIAQMNPTVGDYPGNARKILAWIQQAERKKANLIAFPELALCGYPIWDLANKEGFVEAGLKALRKIVAATKGKRIAVALGFVDRDHQTGASYNALAWIYDGKVRARHYKQLLPTYDVFLEKIFFKPGSNNTTVSWKSNKIGLTICEEIWDDAYKDKPLKELSQKNLDLVINVSASPFYQGVEFKRDALIRKHCVRYKMPILYVNQVGAQDDLVFDGRSFLTDEKGKILFKAPAFEEGLYIYDWAPGAKNVTSLLRKSRKKDPSEAYRALVLGIRDYCHKNEFKKAVIGLSGGIDSALVAVLAAEALGPKAVLGVTMPSTYSSKGSWQDSKLLSENLGIDFENYSIRKKYEFMIREFRAQTTRKKKLPLKKSAISVAMENLQARLRGLELMYISNDQNRILLSTGNKSELAVGYCTLYGDMAGGLAVLGDVYKTDVYRLARYCNRSKVVIPESILNKAPSAELRPDQKDQDSLPPYDILDKILYLYIEKNYSKNQIIHKMKFNKTLSKIVEDVIRKTDHNEYKRRQTPPILRITEKAWFGRRMPVTNRFDRS